MKIDVKMKIYVKMKKKITLLLGAIMMMSFVVACSPKANDKDEVNLVDIKEIHEKIKEEFGEDYIPNMEMQLEELENITGLNGDDVEESIGEMPMISMNVDTFIAIKAKEGKGDSVEKNLEEYRIKSLEESMNYPMNLAKVNAAKVVKHGDYVFFLMLGKFDDRDDATEEEALEFAQEEVNRAEDIIDSFFQ